MTTQQRRGWLLTILVMAATALFVVVSPHIRTYFGLDIQGGVRAVLRAKTEAYKGGKWTEENLEGVRRILENRINADGVTEPQILTKPPDQVVLELPGIKEEKELLERLRSTASLQFYLLPQLGNAEGTQPAAWRIREDPQAGKVMLEDVQTGKPLTPQQLDEAVFSQEPVITGAQLLPNSRAIIDPTTNSPIIAFEFNEEGSARFEEVTRVHKGKRLAIFLDRQLLAAPAIKNVISDKGIIEGKFTMESAKALSDQLNAGALPVPMALEEVRKVEATLGREAVHAMQIAGAVGLGLVLAFMLFKYRLPGLIANLALLLYALFSLAVFKLWPITLTLPGIAGFILSVGMAVDANILIFERLKEELQRGRPLKFALETGFQRAFTAILDSNVCTLLTCMVLYHFGTGPIRGFALTLGLGVAISMFTAITVTRTLLFTLIGWRFAQDPSLYGLHARPHPTLNAMGRKKLWLGLSMALIVPGMVAWMFGGIKPGVDFQGGTELQVSFASRHSAGTIQQALAGLDPPYRDSRVVVSDRVAFVTTKALDEAQRESVVSALAKQVGPLEAGKSVGYSNVSGTISKQLARDALLSVLLASLLIVAYLTCRFAIGGFREGVKYGLCAVAALVHDVLVVWGAFAILGLLFCWQVDNLFVTAMLTIIGFSVHDTIIVFDRIRENLPNRGKRETFAELAGRSIDQTLTRSINTSLTVVMTLLALFILGGSVIHQFTGALLIGIVSGTYSSIFNACVLLVLWKQRGKEGIPK
ncbi:MAG TPA: protein translocase subunit SecD [Chthonomonadaceae bacterium]|nr:protein translocase subunit SecD [Chthonomonadaceae bacterium]